jgi:quercetin dioxygenase-like cupin family protein
LNVLYFPPGTNQTFHIHPSIRLGVVIEGEGYSNLKNDDSEKAFPEKEIPLKKGDLFCIEEREIHRFRTTNSSMIVIPYHPDGDWGPTDHNHSMLNRTYLTK